MLTRREVLKLCLLGASSALLLRGRRAWGDGGRSSFDFWDNPQSPPTRPFVDPLPIFGVAPTVSKLFPPLRAAGGTKPPEGNFTGVKLHQIVEEEVHAKLHTDLPPSRVWRYRGLDDSNTPTPTDSLPVGGAASPYIRFQFGDRRVP